MALIKKIIFFIGNDIIRPFVFLFIRKVDGLENLPQKGGYIIAANHGSWLDTFAVPGVILKHKKKLVHYIAKKELFSNFLLRNFFLAVETIPIDRQKGGKEGMKEALKTLKNGEAIGIFPEGTRTENGELSRAKTGAARLALWAKVPIIPVGLDDPFKIWPKKRLIPRFKRFDIKIGKPIYLDKYYKKRESKRVYYEISDEIMRHIAKLSNKKYNFE